MTELQDQLTVSHLLQQSNSSSFTTSSETAPTTPSSEVLPLGSSTTPENQPMSKPYSPPCDQCVKLYGPTKGDKDCPRGYPCDTCTYNQIICRYDGEHEMIERPCQRCWFTSPTPAIASAACDGRNPCYPCERSGTNCIYEATIQQLADLNATVGSQCQPVHNDQFASNGYQQYANTGQSMGRFPVDTQGVWPQQSKYNGEAMNIDMTDIPGQQLAIYQPPDPNAMDFAMTDPYGQQLSIYQPAKPNAINFGMTDPSGQQLNYYQPTNLSTANGTNLTQQSTYTPYLPLGPGLMGYSNEGYLPQPDYNLQSSLGVHFAGLPPHVLPQVNNANLQQRRSDIMEPGNCLKSVASENDNTQDDECNTDAYDKDEVTPPHNSDAELDNDGSHTEYNDDFGCGTGIQDGNYPLAMSWSDDCTCEEGGDRTEDNSC